MEGGADDLVTGSCAHSDSGGARLGAGPGGPGGAGGGRRGGGVKAGFGVDGRVGAGRGWYGGGGKGRPPAKPIAGGASCGSKSSSSASAIIPRWPTPRPPYCALSA